MTGYDWQQCAAIRCFISALIAKLGTWSHLVTSWSQVAGGVLMPSYDWQQHAEMRILIPALIAELESCHTM